LPAEKYILRDKSGNAKKSAITSQTNKSIKINILKAKSIASTDEFSS